MQKETEKTIKTHIHIYIKKMTQTRLAPCVIQIYVLAFASLAALLWLSVFVLDVLKDIPLTVHQERLTRHSYRQD